MHAANMRAQPSHENIELKHEENERAKPPGDSAKLAGNSAVILAGRHQLSDLTSNQNSQSMKVTVKELAKFPAESVPVAGKISRGSDLQRKVVVGVFARNVRGDLDECAQRENVPPQIA
jgi:hypothetical protein